MTCLYALPILLVTSGVLTATWQLFLAYILSGLGMAGIGMGVMHDALHGSYSKNQTLNKWLGYTLNMVGAHAAVWKIQHNVLHHTYTNIPDGDDDINPPFVLRFSPHAPHYPWHKYQHYYVWFFYGLSTISWVTSKDFIRLTRYYKMGLVKDEKTYRKTIWNIIAWKLVYYTFILVLPILFSPFGVGQILLAFLALHFVTGLSISLIFQTAHITPEAAFPSTDSTGTVPGDRMSHQLATTCNYSPKSPLFSWCIGGLNYQVEHHLFPDICHIHYAKIAPVVAETAAEFGIPYYSKLSFLSALKAHTRMIRELGQPVASLQKA
ncbi:MAG: fatty acid desaturase family protein [Nitritalea sp.]